MPRRPEGSFDRRRERYVAALGAWYTGKDNRLRRRTVTLTYLDGTPVVRGDVAGRAEALARAIRAADDEDRRRAVPSFAEVGLKWINWHRDEQTTRQSDATRVAAVEAICNLEYRDGRRLGSIPVSEWDVEHLDWVRSVMAKADASPGYIRQRMSTIEAVFRWANQVIHGRDPLVLLERNPFPPGKVRKPSAARSHRACPDWPELRAILDRLDAHVDRATMEARSSQRAYATVNALHVRVIGERGCRPNETCELRVDQWDEKVGGFRMGSHKTAHRGVVGVLPLGPSTADRVRALIALPSRRGPWVFAPHLGEAEGPMWRGVIGRWWRGQAGAVGAGQYTLYSFRNAVSNHLRLRGIDGRELQVALRQTGTIADSVYRRDALEDAAEVFRKAGM
jgi:integrase